jgi:transcriptional regulator with XRE-family HTH domain
MSRVSTKTARERGTGQRYYRWRAERGWSQAEAAAAVGIGAASWWLYESGRREPGEANLHLLRRCGVLR